MSLPLVNPERSTDFPAEFRFGTGDSDLQTIGEDYTLAEEGSEPTMWRHFTQDQGSETPGPGIDRYHRWAQDVEQMRRMGMKHYRTSVSMSRLLTRDGGVNGRAVDWYRRYFSALKESGISLYVTLYHWELPQYLNERGGWTNRETAIMLRKHAEATVEHLGEFIDEFFILNEPWCSSMLSYYEGAHAPGKQHGNDAVNLKDAILAAHHLLLAQGLAYRAISERMPGAKIGTVLNFQPSYTVSTSLEDRQAAQYRDGYFNTWFLDPTFKGSYPEQMVALYGENAMPANYEADMETIKVGDKLHALGINYYRGGLYRAAGGELRSEEVLLEGTPLTGLGWPIYQPPYYPEGLYDILQQVYYGYEAFGLKRIYVSENGMALETPWDGKAAVIEDGSRIDYMREHLRQLHKALLHGIPVEGYFAWTLMDKFEWAEGYKPESAFGMIHVDRASQKRVWKSSAAWYSELLKSHSLTQAGDTLPQGQG